MKRKSGDILGYLSRSSRARTTPLKRIIYRESLASFSSLPKQVFLAYIYIAALIFMVSAAGLPKYFLVIGLFLGVLVVIWDETKRLSSLDRYKAIKNRTTLLVKVDKNMNSDVLEMLRQLKGMNEEDVAWMHKVGFKVHIKPDGILIHEKEPINSLYIVLSGKFEVSTTSKKKFVFRNLSSDKVSLSVVDSQVIGEMSFVEEQNYLPSATVKAMSDSWVWSIPKSVLKKKLEDDSLFASRFYKVLTLILANRLRSTNELRAVSENQVKREQRQFNLFPKLSQQDMLPIADVTPGLALFMFDYDCSVV